MVAIKSWVEQLHHFVSMMQGVQILRIHDVNEVLQANKSF